MAAVIEYLDKAEIDICVRINRFAQTDSVRLFFSVVSRLGDGWIWVAAGMIPLLLHGFGAADTVLLMGLTALAGVLIYKALKTRLIRERPYIASQEIAVGTAPLDRYSFPSGHTLHAVCFAVMLGSFVPPLLALLTLFAILVALSRVILGLHYPSDVLMGAAIGGGLGSAAVALHSTFL